MNGQQFRTSHPSDNDAMKSFDQESTFFDNPKGKKGLQPREPAIRMVGIRDVTDV